MKDLIKQYKKIIIAGAVIVVLIIIIATIKILDENERNKNLKIEDIQVVEETNESIEENMIVIHITGAVANEGILKIPEGSRIADAIEKAGGLTENASLNKVNLAYELEDGQKLYIPNLNDEDIGENIDDGISEDVIIETYDNNKKLVNINKADAKELQELNGIGESIAIAIIKYREENGKFNKIEDLKNVAGIGENKYELIKELITV